MNIALLHHLRAAHGSHLPVGSLADDPADAERAIEELMAFGFAIERHPVLGVAYRGPAGRLCPDQIEYELGTVRIGRQIAVWNRVGSTNDLAAAAARSRANDGLVVLAEEQSAGRGRRGRVWTAPPRSSLLLSVLLFPEGLLAEPGWLTALAAVAVADVVSAWSGGPAEIKWPNDVRVHGRKIAGILVERGAGAVIGIGLNANVEPSAFPDDLRQSVTSLRAILGAEVDRSELARDLIRALDRLYTEASVRGIATLRAAWRERSEHVGRHVRVATPDGNVMGTVADLDPIDGLLMTEGAGGRVAIPAANVLAITPVAEKDAAWIG